MKKWKTGRSQEERLMMKRRLIDDLGGKCIDCGYHGHLAALHFDHVDPTIKINALSNLLTNKGYDYLLLLHEARKCVIRCANCHAIKTWPQATM